ncbi:uncharacterized protein LOC111110741 [Crassostrea virginica]|uniref:Annexin A7-like n=1 Tax=Crassostrea virginica TaxID=6565 RepID=A0A8B8BJN8_CRAVI|nr:annexin A7-like [Crassostrea virginica]
MSNDDPSKYGAPPSYEEAVSANPQTNAPIQGYTPVQGGVPPYPVNSDGTGGMPYSPYTAYPTSYPTSQYPPQSGYPPTVSSTGVYPGQASGCGYGQYGQNRQIPTELDRRRARRKLVFMTLFIFIMLLVIFALIRWFLT